MSEPDVGGVVVPAEVDAAIDSLHDAYAHLGKREHGDTWAVTVRKRDTALRSAITTALAAARREGIAALRDAGFRVVPEEPTTAMLNAGGDLRILTAARAEAAALCWRAMLGASPKEVGDG